MAIRGFVPVPEIQFDGFTYPAFDQIVSHLAKYRMRTRGEVDMPVTVRIPSFGGIGAVEHHSESTETYWVHTAGLKVVVPSTPLGCVLAAAARDRQPGPGDLPGAQAPLLEPRATSTPPHPACRSARRPSAAAATTSPW